ncbi:lysophospholipid acyltransferase LPEAT1-like [Punica granatum]|uniref:Lysophospholipid acyltransferase LPEAT1-like n=1 Tax=Punica granatum TaxID=22663 RepID=A0A218WRB1_PUNGR|nr:lysophospholipid acyltransferase LPEAT1-like [Punica granatum]OWM74502.1 hypothetical protein CDL15_Pgr004005 [Punica granatum]
MASEIDPAPTSLEQNVRHVDFEGKFAPFLRHDVYGRFGHGELPWAEKVLIAFAMVTLVPVRLTVCATMLAFYYLVCRVCTLFQAPNRDFAEQEDYAHMNGWRRTVIVNLGKFLSRIFLFVLGFYRINEITVQPHSTGNSRDENEGRELRETRGRPGAIISNHVSYIDIVYHMSSSFPSFVAKKSVAKLPIVGHISKCLGCIYVKRESKSFEYKLRGISAVVARRIQEAHQNKAVPQLMLFPEGTTTNGDFLLPFKTGAFLSRAPVVPVILRYPWERFSLAWESISGGRHALFLLCQFVNRMEVTRLPVYYPSTEEMSDPKLYAYNLRRLMADEGNLKLSDVGLPEKRAYLSALLGNSTLSSDFPWKDD